MAKNPEKKAMKKVAKKAAKKQLKKLSRGQMVHGPAMVGSDYMHTLMDAINFPGVKIPDAVTTPSFTIQCLNRFTVSTTLGTGGNTGAGAYRTLGSTYATGTLGYATLAPSATANVYTPTGVTLPWLADVALAQSLRLVSAKMIVKYLASPNNATGRLLLAFLPPGIANYQQDAASGGAFVSINVSTQLLTTPNLVDIPAAKGYGEVRYVPIDPIALAYENQGSLAININRPRPLTAVYLPTYGAFCVIADGLPVSAQLEVEIWENYECLSQANLVNLVQPTASKSDPIELAAVTNLLADAPTLSATQDPAAALVGNPFVSPGGVDISPADISNRAARVPSGGRRVARNTAINEMPSAGQFLMDARSNMGDIFQDVAGVLPILGPLVGSLFAGL
jgi:hypothetical protein